MALGPSASPGGLAPGSVHVYVSGLPSGSSEAEALNTIREPNVTRNEAIGGRFWLRRKTRVVRVVSAGGEAGLGSRKSSVRSAIAREKFALATDVASAKVPSSLAIS